jgi:aspartyl-tRNA synthetase
MNTYRTHNCSELRSSHIGQTVKLSGWVHKKRDHGGLLFIDLRDHYGITQIVTREVENENFAAMSLESVITIEGKVVPRPIETKNAELSTGDIEIELVSCKIESIAQQLPFSISAQDDTKEEITLTYRFLDLRRKALHNKIMLRSEVIKEIRRLMHDEGFTEFQTPILTASSPEGARDFLVPSRLHKGHFYALPQAPQQFKQLLMIAGFDRYFQIAPCFRDEDARADRSPGEFYQLDIEMSFVTQEEIFTMLERILHSIFSKFSSYKITQTPFPRIPYHTSMLEYGSDKPDLRNPLKINDATPLLKDCTLFEDSISRGCLARCIKVSDTPALSRKFFSDATNFITQEGAKGLAYIKFKDQEPPQGPLAKFLTQDTIDNLCNATSSQNGDTIFFICDKPEVICSLMLKLRTYLAESLNLIKKDCYEFCWITDFPFYEIDEQTKQLAFSHNPFSMPQGGIEAIKQAKTKDEYLNIKAHQYDIVCNGIELSSGAIRNHQLELLYAVFEVVGYSKDKVNENFSGMVKALQFGAPPHGGIAPGIDRIVMLLTQSKNLREIIAFPLNQQAQDLLVGAPSKVSKEQLELLGLELKSCKK